LIIVIACVLAIAVIAFVLGVRPQDLPAPEVPSPFRHLDERKAAIYENLRDLQFEFRVGKLSEEDYRNTKQDLQKELAGVLAEVDKLKQTLGQPDVQAKAIAPQAAKAVVVAAQSPNGLVCPSCGAKFEKQLKFCGECGKPMKAVQA
jgi:NADH pyrophosphatase NudC (nudix superfamily)